MKMVIFAMFQIITLKAALARQNEEHGHQLRSTMSSPDIFRARSGEVSPGNPNPRQPMEDVGNIEVMYRYNCYFQC